MQFILKIITDIEVLTLLKDETFLLSWIELSKKDKKVTVMQEPPFVITWYNQYISSYIPILCLAYDEKDTLVGLMPLAKNINDNTITHAGAGQAEYHGWIAHPDIDEEFPVECLIRLKTIFNMKTWQWRWLPPKAPVKWLSSQLLTNKKIYVTLNTQSSPLWDLSDKAKYEKILKNKSLKSKINRYKAKGLYYLERITDKDKTRELMDILKVQCDFRKEAINNVRPFANNPNKASFYIERQNYPIANHFTVLWSNDKPIAFHFGACVNDTVFIGLSAYDPTESKDSPGTLLLIELGKMLFETGYRYIDLTPGSDQYKECFSNAYQELVEPKFYFSKQEKIKNDTIYQITHIAKKIVSRVGLDIPKIHNLNIINLRNIKKIPFTKVFQKTIRLIYNHHTYLFYRLSTESIKINNNIDSEVNVQKYSDLLLYTESNPWLTRQQLLSEALKRFSMGEILYSIVKEDILVHYGWLSKEKKEYRVAEADMIINVPPDGILLYDFYTEPQFQHQGLYQRNMKQMIFDACKMDAKEIYIGACQNDLFSRQLIEKAGFFLFHTFSKKQVLFHTLSENIVNNF